MLSCFCLLMLCLSAASCVNIRRIGRSSETLGEGGNTVRLAQADADLLPHRIGLMAFDWRSLTASFLPTPLIPLLQNKY
jgi:hypothetical protein